tara:strand:+ start:428 stop:784 length:357 start_codon:yes stop_codon:yes gene_type:complete
MMYIFCEGKRRNSLVGVKKYAKKKQTHNTNYKIFISSSKSHNKNLLGALMCHRHRVCSHQHVDCGVAENDYYCWPSIRDDNNTLFRIHIVHSEESHPYRLPRALNTHFYNRRRRDENP